MAHSVEEGEEGIDVLLSEIRQIEDTLRQTPPLNSQSQQQHTAQESLTPVPTQSTTCTPRDGGASSNRMPSCTESPASRRKDGRSAIEGKGSAPSDAATITPRRSASAKVPHFALPTQASTALLGRGEGVVATYSPTASPRRPLRTPRGSAVANPTADESRGHEEQKRERISGVATPREAQKSSARSRGQDLQSLQETQDTVAKLKEEVRLMRSEMKRKETALLETTREVEELKKRNMMLNTALSSHRHEIRELRAEKTAYESLSLQSESIDDVFTKGGVSSRPTCREQRSHHVRRLEQEKNFLLAAVNRYDAAVASLKEVISVMVTQKMKWTSENGRSPGKNDPVQDKLREVLDSLMRVKEEQILPPHPADGESDSSQCSGDDLAEGGDPSHEPNNKRMRLVRSWVEECTKLRSNNRRLSQTVAQQEKTIKSQHLRITSLTDKLDALGSSIRESKQRRWVLSAKAPTGQGGNANRQQEGEGDVVRGSEEDVSRPGTAPGVGAGWGGTFEPGGQVPLDVYEHMEREAMLLRTELRDKEVAVQERAEVVEHLERKLHVMSHSKDSEIRKIRREAAAAVAGYGIKVSVGGAEPKEPPRRGPSGVGGVPKKASPSTVSTHRGPGDPGYSNTSMGSFYHRQSMMLPPSLPAIAKMPESSKADAQFMASHASSSIELGDGGIGHEPHASEHRGGISASSSAGGEVPLSGYKIFDDVGFLDQADESAMTWQ